MMFVAEINRLESRTETAVGRTGRGSEEETTARKMNHIFIYWQARPNKSDVAAPQMMKVTTTSCNDNGEKDWEDQITSTPSFCQVALHAVFSCSS